MWKKDDEGISEGSRRYDRADQGTQESKERGLKHEGKLQALKRMMLRQKIDQEDRPTKEQEESDTFKTMTLKEEEDAAVQKAHDQPTADSLVQDEKMHDQEIEQAETEKQEEDVG